MNHSIFFIKIFLATAALFFLSTANTLCQDTVSYQEQEDFIFFPKDTSKSQEITKHAFYALSYDEINEQARWVAYSLTKEEVYGGGYERTDNFREDTSICSGSASLNDYRGSGYDRGHLAPAGDMGFSPMAMSESFYMSNMSPQAPSFNRGIWKELETKVRDWAVAFDTV